MHTPYPIESPLEGLILFDNPEPCALDTPPQEPAPEQVDRMDLWTRYLWSTAAWLAVAIAIVEVI